MRFPTSRHAEHLFRVYNMIANALEDAGIVATVDEGADTNVVPPPYDGSGSYMFTSTERLNGARLTLEIQRFDDGEPTDFPRVHLAFMYPTSKKPMRYDIVALDTSVNPDGGVNWTLDLYFREPKTDTSLQMGQFVENLLRTPGIEGVRLLARFFLEFNP